MKPCQCKNPSLVHREGAWVCAACKRPVESNSSRPASKHVTLPPEKAEALRAISNFRREVNQRLDELKAEVLKQ